MKFDIMEKLIALTDVVGENIYAVGGFVRNLVLKCVDDGVDLDFIGRLNETANGLLNGVALFGAEEYLNGTDIDVCGTASAQSVAAAAKSCGFTVKAEYPRTGTVLLESDGIETEYTTFRTESYLCGGHSPSEVIFTDDITLDAMRRDFKCNAVYFNLKSGEIVDPLGGIEDIKNRRLTTCKEPELTFKDDGLRLMRLARFSAELGFAPTAETVNGALLNSKNILEISAERIYSELIKILQADKKYCFSPKDGHYKGLELMSETRVFDLVLPEISLGRNMQQNKAYHKYDVLEHTFKTVLYSESPVRLAALFHDIGKPETFIHNGNFYNHEKIGEELTVNALTRLKAPKAVISETARLVLLHMEDADGKERDNKLKIKIAANVDIFDKLLLLKKADYIACHDDLNGLPACYNKWQNIYARMLQDGTPLSISDLKINGNDLTELGYRGKEIGESLQNMLRDCIMNPALNVREKLIKRAAAHFIAK